MTSTIKKTNTEIMGIYGMNESMFNSKPFTVIVDNDTVISDKHISFALLQLERNAFAKFNDNEIDELYYRTIHNEIKCCIHALEGITMDMSDITKRRISCIIPVLDNTTIKSVKAQERNGFDKVVKNDLKVLSAKMLKVVGKYIECNEKLNNSKISQADKDCYTQKQKDLYLSAKNIAQNAFNVVLGNDYLKVKQSDIQKLIYSAQELKIVSKDKKGDKENSLAYTTENVAKMQAKLLLLMGNALAGKTLKTVTNDAGAEKVLKAESARLEKEQAKQAKEQAKVKIDDTKVE